MKSFAKIPECRKTVTNKIPRQRKGHVLFKSNSDWWHNACLNFNGIDVNAYAIGYKQAADFLVERIGQERRYQDTLVYPIAFLYRQYLELRLKHLMGIGSVFLEIPRGEKNLHHGISKLWERCRSILEKIEPGENEVDFDDIEKQVAEFARIDPSSTAFRYPTDKEGKPSLEGLTHINLRNLSQAVGKIAAFLDGAAQGIEVLLQDKYEMESWRNR
jgi:hypothetical protein